MFELYRPREKNTLCDDCVTVSGTALRLPTALYEQMGSPKRIQLYFDSDTAAIGIKGGEPGLLVNTRHGCALLWKNFVRDARLEFPKPSMYKITKEGDLWVIKLRGNKAK